MKPDLIKLAISFFLFVTACSGNQKPVLVKFEGSKSEKKWAIQDLNPELPSDWTSFGYLTFEMNSSTTQHFEIKVYDEKGIRSLEILPFQDIWIRVSVPLIHFRKMNTEGSELSSVWKTPRPGYWIGFTGSVGSINHVDSLGIAMNQPIGSPSLGIRNIRLTMKAEDTIFAAKPLVDEFGQWISAGWPGKAKTIIDLKNAWTEEENILKSETSAVSKYGGFLNTRAKATGFFRVEKINDRWWFVDPEGLLFFSNGSCCIEPRSDLARLRGREFLFTALPPDAEISPSAHRHGKGEVSSFYAWNLYRRFGSDWYQKWMDLTFRRMDSWGINTIGNWSEVALEGSHRKAYVSTLSGWGVENGTMGMPDVYAPDYPSKVDADAAQQCTPLKDDPYLLGYFIGNEPPWPGRETELADAILSGKATPMQKALKKFLSGGDTPERRKTFVYDSYSRFISLVCSAIKKYDPHHLNLGLRFGGPPSSEIIRESKGYFDVFSINHYDYAVDLKEIQNIYDQTGLPIIIGEFHFGTTGLGLAPGLVQTRNLEERGVAYCYYIENAAAHPAVIGAHWFQWVDQPTTGRDDGENYNIGLVDVTDRPYPEMIKATRETYKRLQNIHSGKMQPVNRQARIQ